MGLIISHKGLARKIISRTTITSVDSGRPIEIMAMWDTGATASLISDKIATELQLKDVGFTQIRHVAGTATFPIYTAAVDIRNGIKISEHRLISFPGADTFDMIIGMDIITLGNFCIENRNGDSIFSFSKETYS